MYSTCSAKHTKIILSTVIKLNTMEWRQKKETIFELSHFYSGFLFAQKNNFTSNITVLCSL